ncbi:hypothetical protein QTP88_021243 [Uroleucon formosanum]
MLSIVGFKTSCVTCDVITYVLLTGPWSLQITPFSLFHDIPNKKLNDTDKMILAKELHKPVRKRFPKRRIYTKGIDDLWASDLVIMRNYSNENDGYCYIITVIDTFSKFSRALELKQKDRISVSKAFEKIIEQAISQNHQVLKLLHIDKGLEFKNKHFKKVLQEYGIKKYYTQNKEKSSIIERFNRTFNSKMRLHFEVTNSKKWIKILKSLIYEYNFKDIHRSIDNPVIGRLKQALKKKNLKVNIVFLAIYKRGTNEENMKYKECNFKTQNEILRQNSNLKIIEIEKTNHIDLLYLTVDDKEIDDENTDDENNMNKGHYCWIKYLWKLCGSQMTKDGHKRFLCKMCLNSFDTENKLNYHKHYCTNNKAAKIVLPESYNKTLEFEKYNNSLRAPFVIFADFEATPQPIYTCKPSDKEVFTNCYQKHIPNNFCYYIKYSNGDYKPPVEYSGPNVAQENYECIKNEEKAISKIYDKIVPMETLNAEQLNNYYNKSDKCHICERYLSDLPPMLEKKFKIIKGVIEYYKQFKIVEDDDSKKLKLYEDKLKNEIENKNKNMRKVRDHDHLTGEYRGAAHSICSGLYKDVLPQTQLVYYDDPNESVTRLNLLTSLQSVGFSSFEASTGLRQGDALSPTLFNIALEKVIKSLPDYQEMELLGNKTILAYADDIMVIGCSREEIITKTADLIAAAKPMGLEISQDKTKYMVIGRNYGNTQNLIVGDYTFQTVTDFKYLGTNINNANNMHNEIKLRVAAANKGYFALEKLFKSRFLSIKSKSTLYSSYLRPVLSYGCETWSVTKGDEEKLLTFERKVLRRIYGPIIENGEYRRRTNREVYQIYSKPNIKSFIRSKQLEWAGHAWRSTGIIKDVMTGTMNGKRPRGRPR